ncbi:MAG: hypothetical protein RLZZ58_2299 [Pseudomonadota bacterium]
MIFAAAALMLGTAAPLDAADDAPVAAARFNVPDDDIRQLAAIVGRSMAGQRVGGGNQNVDKLLFLGRDESGQPVVTGIMVLTSRQSPPTGDPAVLAFVRTQKTKGRPVPGPSAADLAFVAGNGIALYVVGEWARPAPVWEIARVDGAVRFRPIGELGEIGPWQD